jgi:hypothetical protein
MKEFNLTFLILDNSEYPMKLKWSRAEELKCEKPHEI